MQWHPTPVLLPGKSHGWRSLEGCSPWGLWGSDMTERLYFYFSLSCIGEGNGNPLQCSCLENPRVWGAWRAAVYGVTQSWTRLKQWNSSSSSMYSIISFANSESFTSLPIWIPFISFFFLWLSCLGFPRLCWIIVARLGTLVLFLILEEMLSVFHCWECLLCVCHRKPLLCWGSFLLCLLSRDF